MSGNTELIIERERLAEMLNIAMRTLEQISTTPRNKGAKRNAHGTLAFLRTQMEEGKRTPNDQGNRLAEGESSGTK